MKKTIELKISGMHCQSCEKLIAQELAELNGVIDSKINYSSGRGLVSFESDKISEAAIIGAGIKKVVCLCNIEHQSDPDSVTTTEKFRFAKVDVEEYRGPLRDILLKLENKSFLSRAQSARMEKK